MDSLPNENVCHAGLVQHSVRIHKRPPSSAKTWPVAGMIKTQGSVTTAVMPVSVVRVIRFEERDDLFLLSCMSIFGQSGVGQAIHKGIGEQ